MRTKRPATTHPAGPGAAVRLSTALLAVCTGACAVLAVGAPPARAADGPGEAFTLTDPRITESSGLAASQVHPGVYWTHNDSDDGPYVYAVDSGGRTVATVTLRGVEPRDVEAVSLGPDGRLYLGDIGDNLGGKWPEVWIYAFAEPAELRDQTVEVTRYKVRYEDGPRDAEALMVHPVTGRAYIASKRQGGGGLYQGPEKLSPTGVNTFRRIGEVSWITDGAFSPDGTRLVLRGYFSAALYRWKDGAPAPLGALTTPFQQQGESVTFSADGRALLYGSEGKASPVWRAPLDDGQLPDTVKPLPRPTATTTPGAAAPPGGASPDASASGGSSDGPFDQALGVLFLAAVVGAVLGLRRKKKSD
ncbi:hypothetical protein PUR61_14765 [Streptomyces sp. BE20]|uniref:hypothetical protein n=1 Tax=Streptomyces sp. BE20 TaxID=3002525 RepID=UPI002E75FD37|nr:hypothetical protein [Streptomyces sp. BE20]MEE1823442.1 hypothetical protein [Streptomyces sp. BE20]